MQLIQKTTYGPYYVKPNSPENSPPPSYQRLDIEGYVTSRIREKDLSTKKIVALDQEIKQDEISPFKSKMKSTMIGLAFIVVGVALAVLAYFAAPIFFIAPSSVSSDASGYLIFPHLFGCALVLAPIIAAGYGIYKITYALTGWEISARKTEKVEYEKRKAGSINSLNELISLMKKEKENCIATRLALQNDSQNVNTLAVKEYIKQQIISISCLIGTLDSTIAKAEQS